MRSFNALFKPFATRAQLHAALTASIRSLVSVVVGCGLIGVGSTYAAYPEKPIVLVVPFAAGGSTDKTARDLAEAMRKPLGGAAVVVENRGGAGGTLGSASVARAAPDGYTIMLHHIGMATAPSLYRGKLQYNTLEDFEYLGLFEEAPMSIVGRPGLPAATITEVLSWARAQNGSAKLSNAGIGSASHLCGLMLMKASNVGMIAVPYKGTGPAMNDLMGGQVDLMCDQTTNTSELIVSGRIRAFAVTTENRLQIPGLQNTPTLIESGMPGFNIAIWHGLYAPKGVPASVLTRLKAALQVAVRDPAFVSRQEAMGARWIRDERTSPEGHKKFVASEMSRWGAVIRAAGQYAE